MIFAAPVRSPIQPEGWKRPRGNRDFRVTQPFGCTGFKHEPALGSCAHFHRGIDLSDGRCGSPVFAAAGGTVFLTGLLANKEVVVVINHGSGIFSFYGHLASRSVNKGNVVTRGKQIGTVGATGNALGCHLHFQVKYDVDKTRNVYADSNGRYVDPWPLLEQNVTIHLKADDGIRVRNAATTDGDPFATTQGGRIVRFADGVDLGASAEERKWGGEVTGGSYVLDGETSRSWERIHVDGEFRFVAAPLTVRSAY